MVGQSRIHPQGIISMAGWLQAVTIALLVIGAFISATITAGEREPDPGRFLAAIILVALASVPVAVIVIRSRDAVRASWSVIWMLLLLAVVYSVATTNAYNIAYAAAGIACAASIALLLYLRWQQQPRPPRGARGRLKQPRR
jgi:uncharacterized membrane protein YhaH (DUF805 family)